MYAKVYDVPPYIGDPFFSVETFGSRLDGAFEMDGFELVTARLEDGTLVGYVHGVTPATDRPWWVSLGDVVPVEPRKAAEAGPPSPGGVDSPVPGGPDTAARGACSPGPLRPGGCRRR
ncbi:hypothetical protein [Streptomyces sp. bgisy060]|uniref:hypothetical protein n=1 Tax=Streptomyces sp. bgisy060 TaxID=3413775 RepID=UPI003EB79942